MKVYIACGTDCCNEPETFHVFLTKEQAIDFVNKKNLERYNKLSMPYYDIYEGEFYNEKD